MSDREIYHSENGDKWLLCKDADQRVYIQHWANLSSGGKVTRIEIGAFLATGNSDRNIKPCIG
jgi:hypothetical protein